MTEPRTAPLTAGQEALFREGLRTAPSLDPADTLPRSHLEYSTAEWADRCRQLLATLDRERAASLDRDELRKAEPLDVRRVVQAIANVAIRHHVVKDPPVMSASLASMYGYSTTIPDMDAQIAAEYALLSAGDKDKAPLDE